MSIVYEVVSRKIEGSKIKLSLYSPGTFNGKEIFIDNPESGYPEVSDMITIDKNVLTWKRYKAVINGNAVTIVTGPVSKQERIYDGKCQVD